MLGANLPFALSWNTPARELCLESHRWQLWASQSLSREGVKDSISNELQLPYRIGLAHLQGTNAASIGDLDYTSGVRRQPTVATKPEVNLFKGDEDAFYVGYDAAERQQLAESIAHALQAIGNVNANAYEFVCASLLTIAVRKDLQSNYPFSSSWRTLPGFAAFSNVHSSPVQQAFLMNALIHEAVHSALYCIEGRGRFITGSVARMTSPWTGASLRAESYVHACFVWFALANFWGLDRIAFAGVSPPVSWSFLYRALTGFQVNPSRCLTPHATSLRSGLLECIDLMGEKAKMIASIA